MLSSLKRSLGPYYRNLGGWRTDRKLLVIESDDWGSIRMPSRSVYEECLRAGYPVDRIAYERFDAPLSNDDLEHLLELLSSFRDSKGKSPVITANCLVANPDFERIESSGFEEYHYELVTETLKKYPKHDRSFSLWLKGHEAGLLRPQFHGREHLNVTMFMRALREKDEDAMFGFKHRMPGCIPKGPIPCGNLYVEATRFRSAEEKDYVQKAIIEGLGIFEKLFGFRSKTLIPTNYRWSRDFDGPVSQCGVSGFQGNRVMLDQQNDGSHIRVKRKLGESNSFGQMYLARNATFEPSLFAMKISDPVAHCLREINAAFLMGKPAIISSHRINFCGFIDSDNRDRNLRMLRRLLENVIKKWPSVEFLSSDQFLLQLRAPRG